MHESMKHWRPCLRAASTRQQIKWVYVHVCCGRGGLGWPGATPAFFFLKENGVLTRITSKDTGADCFDTVSLARQIVPSGHRLCACVHDPRRGETCDRIRAIAKQRGPHRRQHLLCETVSQAGRMVVPVRVRPGGQVVEFPTRRLEGDEPVVQHELSRKHDASDGRLPEGV